MNAVISKFILRLGQCGAHNRYLCTLHRELVSNSRLKSWRNLPSRFQTVGINMKPRTQFHMSHTSHGLDVGDAEFITKTFTSKEVSQFAEISGDHNPIHVDEEYAVKSRFKKPIVHGALCMGLLSGVLSKQLGDGAILLHYEMAQPGPLFVDEEVTAKATVMEIISRKVKVSLVCYTPENKVVAQGTAMLLVPRSTVRQKTPEMNTK